MTKFVLTITTESGDVTEHNFSAGSAIDDVVAFVSKTYQPETWGLEKVGKQLVYTRGYSSGVKCVHILSLKIVVIEECFSKNREGVHRL